MAQIPIQRKERSNIWPLLLGLLALLAVLWFLFARKRTDDTAVRPADSTSTVVASNGAVGRDSMANGAMGANGAVGTAAVNNGDSAVPASSKKMTDAEIFSMVRAVNVGEETAGKMAETKASSADVKAFAHDMVKDHMTMASNGTALATALGAIPKPDAKDSIIAGNAAVAAKLRATPAGKAFDKVYIDGQVTGHTRALAFLQHAETEAQNADLKKMLTDAVPEVQQHLERARSLQSKVGM